MSTIAEYERWKAKQQLGGVGAAQVVLGSGDAAPDEIAGNLKLANDFGKATGSPVPPEPLVREYRNVFQQAVEQANAKTILSSSPRLTEWLRNPDNAALARDDLENLSLLERAGMQAREMAAGVPGGAVSAVGTMLEGAGQLLTTRSPEGRRPISSAIATAGTKSPEEIAALRAEIFRQGAVNPTIAQSVLSEVLSGDMTPAEAYEALEPALEGALTAASDALQSAGEATQKAGSGILPAAPGMEDSFGRDVGSGLGSLLTILGVGFLTGPIGAAVAGGSAGAGEAASRARLAGQDEDTQTIAALYGILPGMTDAIPVERLLANPVVKSGLAAVMRSLAKQAALEGGQEAVQGFLQNAIAQNLYAPDQGLFDDLARSMAAGGFVGALVEAGRIGLNAMLPGRVRRLQSQADQASETAAKITEIGEVAKASALRNRMPDTFRDFVARATENGPAERMYIPAQEFVEYFQSRGVDAYDLIGELDGVTADDLDAAILSGGDLIIPTATYAAKIAGSEHDTFIVENARFDPDAMSAREAEEFKAKVDDALSEAWEAAEELRREQDELRSFEQEIYDTMVSRLRAAGRSTDVATTEAMLYPAFYRVMAERSGLTTEEFMQRYPLPQVEGELPVGMQARDVDTLNRTLAQVRSRRDSRDRRPSLLEFIASRGGISDPGGELRARNADVVTRKVEGRKRPVKLQIARGGVLAGVRDMFGGAAGYGWDDVARAAIEAGYLANDPLAIRYVEASRTGEEFPDIAPALMAAIDRELAGELQYARQDVDEAADAREAELDRVEAYLASLGVSIDDDDAAIRAAIEADQAGQAYGQGPVPDPARSLRGWRGPDDTSIKDFIDLYGRPEAESLLASVAAAPSIDAAHLAGDKWVHERGRATGVEHLTAFDPAGGLMVAGRGARSFVGFPDYFMDALERGSIRYATHNHPRNSGFSSADIRVMLVSSLNGRERSGVDMAITAMGSAGAIVSAAPGPALAKYTIADIRKLAADITAAEGAAYEYVAPKVRGGQMEAQAANLAHSHLWNMVLHRIGLIDLRGNSAQIVKDAGISVEDFFGEKNEYLFDGLRRGGYDISGRGDFISSQRPGGVAGAGEGADSGAGGNGVSDGASSLQRKRRGRKPDPRQLTLFQPAYHGTPHLFDKFSTDKIGTGEGAQAFGWGLYFAGRKDIATWYRNTLARNNTRVRYLVGEEEAVFGGSDTTPRSLAVHQLVLAGRSVEEARAAMLDVLEMYRGDLTKRKNSPAYKTAAREVPFWEAAIEEIGNIDPASIRIAPAGRLLTVDIPDDADLMAWDTPVGEQSPNVQAAIKSLLAGVEFKRSDTETNKINLMVDGKWRGYSRHSSIDAMTGEDVYAVLSRIQGGDRQASEALLAAGVPGHRYLDNASRTFGEGTHNYVIYDDSRINVVSYEQNMGRPRGSIQFPAAGVGNGDTVIRLFQSADLSTMLHESGHYFLTVMQDLARRGEQSASADYETVKGWWRENAKAVASDATRVMPDVAVSADDVIAALDIGTSGDVMKDAAIDVGMQEQWARAFEAYLMEGKAPSADLRTAFEKFRSWLISVYQKLAGLNVQMSDDIRGVFDRMLASDAEIATAQEDAGGAGPLFPDAASMGLTDDEYAAFLKLRSQSEEEAKARLMREIMEPIKRQKEAWFKEERGNIRDEVSRQVNAGPVYRAIEWMGNRRWLGDGQPEDMPDFRMSKDILVQRYGEGILKTLPRGRQTVYAVEGGVDPDDAAGWFGYGSGDELVRAMERAQPRKAAIEAETDRVMRERHGDPLNDGSLQAAALDAVHTDKRGEWIAAELKAVSDVAGVKAALTMKEARATARDTISRIRVRDAIASNRFLAAERKAGEEAARVGAILAREGVWMNAARRRIATKARQAIRGQGEADTVAGVIERANASTSNYNETVDRLIAAKRRQLINYALYMESRRAADEVEKAERYVAKLGKKSHREKIAGAGRRENADIDYLAAMDEILDRYDFRRLTNAAEQRRGSLVAYIEAMTAAGRENELAIPDNVLRDAGRKPYKTLPVEELRGVVDSLKNLEHVALRWNKLIDAQDQRELEAVVSDIVGAFDANLPKRPPGRVGSTSEAVRNSTRQFLDLVLTAGTILREIDGLADFGPAFRNIKAPIDAAMNRLITRKLAAADDLDKLYSVYSKEERRRMAVREFVPELGYSLSKWERIAVALNTGNEGNFQRLTDPRVRGALTEAQVEAVLSTLDARDAAFVQSVWDYIGSFRADIAARERRTTGVEPAWVEPKPVTIAGKALRGGYYPLKYDPRLSSLARDDETQEIAKSLQAGRFGKAQTRNGHVKARAQSSGRDVELDMSVLHRHVNQVIYDLELSEPVANAWRILQNGQVRRAFMESGKQADFDALEIWLKDVAEGELRSADLVGRMSRTLKSNFTAAKLALNLSTVAVQITGVAQSMVVVGKRDFARGVQASFRAGVREEIAAKSAFMRTRQTTFNKDIFDFYADPKAGPVASRWGDIKREYIGPLSFWLMTKVQWYTVDVPTWLAGYQQGLRKFGDEDRAIAHADDIVKRAQASGLFSDRSAVERGSVSRTARQNDVVRLFTALGSYMFAKFNVAYERTSRAARVIGAEGASPRSAQEALSWTLDMAFLFTLEAVLIAALKGRLPDDEDEEDEGWTAFLARETAFGAMGTIPFVRDIASTISGFEGGGAYGAITKELAAPFKQAAQGEVDRAFVKSVISSTGLATGLPSAQINRAVDAAWREAEGEDVSPLEYLLGKSGR